MHTSCLRALFAAALFGVAAPAASAQTTAYVLDPAARFLEGCYDPCTCFANFNEPVTGTFLLQYTSTDAAGFDHHLVLNVDWDVGGQLPAHFTGSGTYMHGGPTGVQERLVLDLSSNGQPPRHFDSGLVTTTVPFPQMDVSVNVNGLVCFDTVFRVAASPGVPFASFRVPGASFCAGDGTGTACPCGNTGAPGNGCASSVNAAGANLSGFGLASLGADSVVLQSSGTPAAPLLFFQGTQQVNSGAGVVFGDGLRCAGGTVRRLKTSNAVGGQAQVPAAGDPALSVLGGIGSPGTFGYQAWYRNAAAFCTSATFNLTNGYEIAWIP